MATSRRSNKIDRIPGARGIAHPRLDIRGPTLLGLLVLTLFFGAGIGAAAYAPLDKGIAFSGAIVVESKVQPVQHHSGGIVGAVLVREGDTVAAGQVIATLDTQQIDEQITALKTQSGAAKRQLALIREEVETLTSLVDKRLAARSRLLALERKVAEIEQEAAGFIARIALAEQELARMRIKAPVAGKVLSMAVKGQGAVIQAGAIIAEIVPQDDNLVLEGRLSPAQIEEVVPGMKAKVWLRALSWRDSRPLLAELSWISPDTVEDKRTGTQYFIARVALTETRAEIERHTKLRPGMRAELLLLKGKRTLLDQLLDPVARNLNRAFRS